MGLIAYSRKEGRALGEVTKFLVYNARKRQEGGDRADKYFLRTECVAGVQDMRFQELMPDAALVGHPQDPPPGLDEQRQVRRHHRQRHRGGRARQDPRRLVPADAKVEIEAKIAAGYFTDGTRAAMRRAAGRVKGVGLE